MLLTSDDIKAITRLGHEPTYFIEEHNGWLQLKNARDHCVFHTGERCGIYDHRPAGCMLYPIVYDIDSRSAILDADCPQRQQFSLKARSVHTLTMLIATLQRERAERNKNSSKLKTRASGVDE